MTTLKDFLEGSGLLLLMCLAMATAGWLIPVMAGDMKPFAFNPILAGLAVFAVVEFIAIIIEGATYLLRRRNAPKGEVTHEAP
jgi:hypothetical protein